MTIQSTSTSAAHSPIQGEFEWRLVSITDARDNNHLVQGIIIDGNAIEKILFFFVFQPFDKRNSIRHWIPSRWLHEFSMKSRTKG